MNRDYSRDYSYCSGVCCRLRQNCKRYLPEPPDYPLWWVEPQYNEKNDDCVNYDKRILVKNYKED